VDLVTQGIIGAAAAQCGARPDRLRIAALAGAVGGLLPDLDVIIRSPSDPLLFLEYHRHFTHSLLFIPVGALIAAFLTRLLTRRREAIHTLYLPSLLGIATHGLLDACTSYGTLLLWPFSSARIAWHIVAIVDPLFTGLLIGGVALAAWRGRRAAARACMALALAYLGLGVVQQQRAQAAQAQLMADRNHQGKRHQVKPSIANNILYRAFYTYEGHYYVDAIRVPWFGEPRVYAGDHVPVLNLEDYANRHALDTLQRTDIARFEHFSDGHLIEDPRAEGVLSDFRYAAVPDAIAPLWGVDVLGTPPGEHLDYQQWTGLSREEQDHFMDMLLGR
jgi:inner membrane protein